MNMQVKNSNIKGCSWVITRTLQEDKYWFRQTYSWPDWSRAGIRTPFLYDGEIKGLFKNTWRGLYKQEYPYEYAMLAHCSYGKALIVAVDMREHSKTFLKHIIIECSAYNNLQIYLEKGFAFGVLMLEDNTLIHIKTDAPFNKSYQKIYRWDDPAFGIVWPEKYAIDTNKFIISTVDQYAPLTNLQLGKIK
jgi:dTDP-4-dehydrorhamnose 3,5-epimerase